VAKLRERGTQFLEVPSAYYTDLRERLKHSKVKIVEDLAEVNSIRTTSNEFYFVIYSFKN
jgi:4-hydroxyphenylpyruvate dioxygenase